MRKAQRADPGWALHRLHIRSRINRVFRCLSRCGRSQIGGIGAQSRISAWILRLRQRTLPQASITIPQGAAPRGTPAAPRAPTACRRSARPSLWHSEVRVSASPDQSRRHEYSPRSLPSLIEPAAVGSFVAHLTPSVGWASIPSLGTGRRNIGRRGCAGLELWIRQSMRGRRGRSFAEARAHPIRP